MGTDEAPGSVIEDPGTGEKRRIYRGMTSPHAVFDALSGDESPDALELALDQLPRARRSRSRTRGSVLDILHRVRGHLRSAR